jgi:hypothetical protein
MTYQKFEKKESNYDGEATVGDGKETKKIGTVKMWKQQRKPNERDLPAFRGYVIIDGKYYRLRLWETN